MKDTTKKIKPSDEISSEDDEILDIKKSVFEVSNDMRKQRLAEQEKLEKEIEARRLAQKKAEQAERDRRLLEEKKELIRLKQGVIEESEAIHEEHEEAVVMSPWKKFRNFIYHNKWWFGIATAFVLIAGVLIHSLLTKPNPDIIVLVICNNPELGNNSELDEYIKGFAEDFNDNGKTEVSVYYIPISPNSYGNWGSGSDDKLSAELQSADSVIVIGDNNLRTMFTDKDTGEYNNIFMDMGELFPDNSHVRNGLFFLRDTDFYKKVGIEREDVNPSLFIAVREPRTLLYTDRESMQETYDKDFPVLEKIIADLSG